MPERTSCCRSLFRGTCSLLLALACVALLAAYPTKLLITWIMSNAIRSATLLSPDAPQDTWNRMVRTDLPGAPADTIYLYMYNITNLDALRLGNKPHLQEIGPYVFEKKIVKEAVRFDRGGDVFYQEYVYFVPHPHSCNTHEEHEYGDDGYKGPDSGLDPSEQTPQCFETDEVVTLNVPLVGVLKAVDSSAWQMRHLIDLAIKQFFYANRFTGRFKGLFMRRTVQEMLFGYEDELLTDLATLVPSLYKKSRFQLMPNMTSPEVATALPRTIMNTVLDSPPSPHPSVFREPSNPSKFPEIELPDPEFELSKAPWLPKYPNAATRAVEGAVREIKQLFGDLETRAMADPAGWGYVQWQGLTEMTCWGEGHTESVVGGSDALQFRPGLTANDSLYIFVPELFRMAKMNVTGTEIANGVTLLKYQPDIAVADPDPRFFTEITGLMNVSACTAVGPSGRASDSTGPDILMSFPHFCYVDPAIPQQTTGVSPCNHSRHDLWLGVEPTTGITMAAKKRLQVSSTFDSRYAAFDPHLRSTVLPILWAEETGEIDERSAAMITSSLYPAQAAVAVLSNWRLYIALLCAVLVLSIFTVFAGPKRAPRSSPGRADLHQPDDQNGFRNIADMEAGTSDVEAQAEVATGPSAAVEEHSVATGGSHALQDHSIQDSQSSGADEVQDSGHSALESMDPEATAAADSATESAPVANVAPGGTCALDAPSANVRIQIPSGVASGTNENTHSSSHSSSQSHTEEQPSPARVSVTGVMGKLFGRWGGTEGGLSSPSTTESSVRQPLVPRGNVTSFAVTDMTSLQLSDEIVI